MCVKTQWGVMNVPVIMDSLYTRTNTTAKKVAVSTKSRTLKVKSAAQTGPTSIRAVRTVCGISPPPQGTASDLPSSTLNWSPTRNAPMTTLRSSMAETSTATAWGGTVGANCHTPLHPVETRCTWSSTLMPQSKGRDFMQATRQYVEVCWLPRRPTNACFPMQDMEIIITTIKWSVNGSSWPAMEIMSNLILILLRLKTKVIVAMTMWRYLTESWTLTLDLEGSVAARYPLRLFRQDKVCW